MTHSAQRSFAIELTALCNQKCSYCYNAWRDDGGKALGPADMGKTIARVEKLLGACAVDHVTVTGGEPFTHPGVFDLLELLRERQVGIQIISNGGAISRVQAESLSRYSVRFVQITLNGSTAALHEAHVGEGHFEKTLRGIRWLREFEVPIVGCIVITHQNAANIGEILELWRSLGVTAVALSRFSPAGYAAQHADRLLPSLEDLMGAFGAAEQAAVEYGMNLYCTMPVPPCAVELAHFPHIGFGVCPIGTEKQEFALGPDGRLRHCTLYGGALFDQDIADPSVDVNAIFGAPEVTHYRKRTPEFCRGCLHEETCGGGCGAAAQWTLGGPVRQPDPLVMQYIDPDFSNRLQRKRPHLAVISR